MSSLQEQLTKSEEVQMDFVRLSQSLQIQLEKIRGADTEVRWQHEEDVSECQECKQPFASAKKKVQFLFCQKLRKKSMAGSHFYNPLVPTTQTPSISQMQ